MKTISLFVLTALMVFLYGCSNPMHERPLRVYEAVCGDQKLTLYKPFNVIGSVYWDSRGRFVDGADENCLITRTGSTEKTLSDLPDFTRY